VSEPKEHWLRSNNHDRVAAAMMQCEHGDPSRCFQDGHCHLDENCFAPITPSVRNRVAELERRLAELELKCR
jgi:hypothetical protein